MATNWTSIFKHHRGKWVALKDDHRTVIASGSKAKTVMKKAKELGYDMPYLFRVPLEEISYVG